MRVLLLNPPPEQGVNVIREGRCMQRTDAWTTVWSPVSLATVAAVLRDEGFEVRIRDGSVEDISGEDVSREVRDWQPSLVVINTATTSIDQDIAVAALVKDAAPACRTLVMGIHPSTLPDECFAINDRLDIIVRGEPEYSIRDAAAAISEDRSLEGIPGLSYRRDGIVHHNERRPFIEDLDELPFPAWDLVDTGRYRLPFTGKRYLLVASARGCPYACTFCASKAYYGARVRKRSPARIVDEISWIRDSFGIRDFLFWAESFTNDQDYAIATAREMIDRNLDVSWVCNSRVDTVSPEFLRTIKEAGCWMIGFGIESGSQEILDAVKKKTTITDVVTAVRMAHEGGLEVTGHCILGLPGETEESLQMTIDLARFLRLDYAQFYCAVAFPGSELYEQSIENGWLGETDWKYFEQNTSILSTPSLSTEQVMAARDRAYLSFYRQPHVVMKTLGKIKSTGDIGALARMAKDFLHWA